MQSALLFIAALTTGCAAQSGDAPGATDKKPQQEALAAKREPDATWRPLMARLIADGVEEDTVNALFSRVEGAASLSPMGTKAYELYRIRFLRPRTQPRSKSENRRRRPFIKASSRSRISRRPKHSWRSIRNGWDRAHKRFGVSPEVTVGLLMVETRLGTYLGKARAFETLASMSATRELSPLLPYLKGNEPTEEEYAWLEEAIGKRADWAYSELKALIEYSMESGADPLMMPCSVYGAVGVCQFMPSNIKFMAAMETEMGKLTCSACLTPSPASATILRRTAGTIPWTVQGGCGF